MTRDSILTSATHRLRDRSEFLAKALHRVVRTLSARLLLWLAELRAAPVEPVEALDQAASFEAWDRSGVDQGLSIRAPLQRCTSPLWALIARLEETS